jgi:hypothetical protein
MNDLPVIRRGLPSHSVYFFKHALCREMQLRTDLALPLIAVRDRLILVNTTL